METTDFVKRWKQIKYRFQMLYWDNITDRPRINQFFHLPVGWVVSQNVAHAQHYVIRFTSLSNSLAVFFSSLSKILHVTKIYTLHHESHRSAFSNFVFNRSFVAGIFIFHWQCNIEIFAKLFNPICFANSLYDFPNQSTECQVQRPWLTPHIQSAEDATSSPI